jgi:hypothetical protein
LLQRPAAWNRLGQPCRGSEAFLGSTVTPVVWRGQKRHHRRNPPAVLRRPAPPGNLKVATSDAVEQRRHRREDGGRRFPAAGGVVRAAKKPSTAFSYEREVGMRWVEGPTWVLR